jgi:hypothetical protein
VEIACQRTTSSLSVIAAVKYIITKEFFIMASFPPGWPAIVFKHVKDAQRRCNLNDFKHLGKL